MFFSKVHFVPTETHRAVYQINNMMPGDIYGVFMEYLYSIYVAFI